MYRGATEKDNSTLKVFSSYNWSFRTSNHFINKAHTCITLQREYELNHLFQTAVALNTTASSIVVPFISLQLPRNDTHETPSQVFRNRLNWMSSFP